MYIVLLMCPARLNSHVADLLSRFPSANMHQITVQYMWMGLWKPYPHVAEKQIYTKNKKKLKSAAC